MAPCVMNSTDCLPPRGEVVVLVESATGVMITIVCLLGNSVVCICVYRDKHLRSVPNIFIINLAVTNILLCTTVWPFWIVALATGRWTTSRRACHFQGFQNHCLMTSMALTITVLGVNRYMMLVYPFTYRILFKRKNAYRILVVLWFVSIVWATLRFAHMNSYEFLQEIGICESSKSQKMFAFLDLSALVVFIVLTIFCYCKVFLIIRRHVSNVLPDRGTDTPWPPPTGPKAYYYEEVNFTKTSLLIFFAYGLSWFPLILLGLLMLAEVDLSRHLTLLSWFLVALSCSIQPVINIASNKLFRKGFYKVLCSCGFNYEANVTAPVQTGPSPLPI